ncbi:hypothetical protein ADEAN_000552600 [Angomonas deanei]|uniref:C2H2-type domain-containing protein n=1 Tax=Angomonas deanei TaxID=59799 RepID=A0A7G2CDW8_9TRYP|nr:hypothetical protein ADEAN_000552600 [Angomonas deanei]
MTFHFQLLNPPSDVAFLSVIDGEVLFNSKEKLSHEIKTATIRQIGWHSVEMHPDWFTSDRALTTVRRVMQTMQCTIQYLQFLLHYKEKEVASSRRTAKELQAEVNASYEEVVELREIVTLYKLKSSRVKKQETATTHARKEGGLACTLCGNSYPTKGALESHYRKRHKRSETFAAIAAAHTVTSNAVEDAKEVPQHIHNEYVYAHKDTPTPEDTRNMLAVREELAELRLAVARLVEGNSERTQSISPIHVVGYPSPSELPGVALSQSTQKNNAVLEEILSLKELVNATTKDVTEMKKYVAQSQPLSKPPLSKGLPPPLQLFGESEDIERSASWDFNISPMTQRSPSAMQRRKSDSVRGPPEAVRALPSAVSGETDYTDGFSSPRERHSAPPPKSGDSDPQKQNTPRFSLPIPPTATTEFRYNEISTIASRKESPRVLIGSQGGQTSSTSSEQWRPELSASPPMTHRNGASVDNKATEATPLNALAPVATSPSPDVFETRSHSRVPSNTTYSDFGAYEQVGPPVVPLQPTRTVTVDASSSSSDSGDDAPPMYDVESNTSSGEKPPKLQRTTATLGQFVKAQEIPSVSQQAAESSEYSYYTYTASTDDTSGSRPATTREDLPPFVLNDDEESGERDEESSDEEEEEEDETAVVNTHRSDDDDDDEEEESDREVPIRNRSKKPPKRNPQPDPKPKEKEKEKSKVGSTIMGKLKLFGKKKK